MLPGVRGPTDRHVLSSEPHEQEDGKRAEGQREIKPGSRALKLCDLPSETIWQIATCRVLSKANQVALSNTCRQLSAQLAPLKQSVKIGAGIRNVRDFANFAQAMKRQVSEVPSDVRGYAISRAIGVIGGLESDRHLDAMELVLHLIQEQPLQHRLDTLLSFVGLIKDARLGTQQRSFVFDAANTVKLSEQYRLTVVRALVKSIEYLPKHERKRAFDECHTAIQSTKGLPKGADLAALVLYLPSLMCDDRRDRYDAILSATLEYSKACRIEILSSLASVIRSAHPSSAWSMAIRNIEDHSPELSIEDEATALISYLASFNAGAMGAEWIGSILIETQDRFIMRARSKGGEAANKSIYKLLLLHKKSGIDYTLSALAFIPRAYHARVLAASTRALSDCNDDDWVPTAEQLFKATLKLPREAREELVAELVDAARTDWRIQRTDLEDTVDSIDLFDCFIGLTSALPSEERNKILQDMSERMRTPRPIPLVTERDWRRAEDMERRDQKVLRQIKNARTQSWTAGCLVS